MKFRGGEIVDVNLSRLTRGGGRQYYGTIEFDFQDDDGGGEDSIEIIVEKEDLRDRWESGRAPSVAGPFNIEVVDGPPDMTTWVADWLVDQISFADLDDAVRAANLDDLFP